mgnify:CR=1 FL=1
MTKNVYIIGAGPAGLFAAHELITKKKNLKIFNMKIIFLDIDGVLNYDLWYTSETYRSIMSTSENFDLDIDPINAKLINSICKKTNAKIVITSDKRIDWNDTLMQLKRGGINIDLIIDKLTRLRDLATQASNGTYGESSLKV